MASVKKFTEKAVVNQLRHNERTIANPANTDIDRSRSAQNYSLINHGMSCYDYYKQRKGELYCYKREDVKTLAGWVVTAPKDLPANERVPFFQLVHEFLCGRYGERNCVQSIVHADESGQPHIHWLFIPATEDKKHGGEKICANDVINRKDLRNFHDDLQTFLNKKGIHGTVKSGVTQARGGNRTVKQLKQLRDVEQVKTAHRVVEDVREHVPQQQIKINIKQKEKQKEVKQVEQSRWVSDPVQREIENRIEQSRW